MRTAKVAILADTSKPSGAEYSYRHIFQINGEALVIHMVKGDNVIEKALEEFLCWNLMGLISDEQYAQTKECFTEKSFSITALLKIPGFDSHTRG